MNEVIVRQGNLSDIEGYHRCLSEVARERKYLGMVDSPPLDESRRWIQGLIMREQVFLVAVQRERVVGWCDLHRSDREGFKHTAELGIGLISAVRGQGIGRRLMETALAQAAKMGIERVELQVFESNQVAVELYKGLGFGIEGIKVRARKIDGRYENILCMAKLF